MKLIDLVILVPVIVLIIGFVYMNFIFPKKAEKAEKEKEVNKK